MSSVHGATAPNIIFFLFDDLGFSDIGYNGAIYPTPVLDTWANKSAIKLNFHYAESTCSPSRSALFTGRYAFKSGLNTVVGSYSQQTFDRNLVLYPQVLQDNGYNTFYAGKWDLGYKYADNLPLARGFDEGLYTREGVPYEGRTLSTDFDRLQALFPLANAPNSITRRRSNLFPDDRLRHHDFWYISPNGIESEEDIDDMTYVETSYTDEIIAFIDAQRDDVPFYVHYSLLTPHATLRDPPDLNKDWMYNNSLCNIDSLTEEKEIFCLAMLYAQERLDEIVETVKDNGMYDNTVFIVTSDNGPEPNIGSGGSALPLRGIKSAVNEGSLRTPAFMFGGYIADILRDISSRQCEYDGLVHISDWYNILTDLANITHRHSDDDHDLEIWDAILCHCDPSCDSTNNPFTERTEMVSMRVCGDESSYATDLYPAKTFYASYIIQWPWKLIVNGSIAMTDSCPNNLNQHGSWQRRNSYAENNGSWYGIPDQIFFDEVYQPLIDDGLGHLYHSQCLEDLEATRPRTLRPNSGYSQFEYQSVMLYDLSSDKIEACNVYDDNEDQAKKLFDALEQHSKQYNAPQNVEASPGAMWEQVESFDCQMNTTYVEPWEGDDEDICGDPSVPDCTPIWDELNRRKAACNRGSAFNFSEMMFGNMVDTKVKVYITIAVVIGVCLIICLKIFWCVLYMKRRNSEEEEIEDWSLSPSDSFENR